MGPRLTCVLAAAVAAPASAAIISAPTPLALDIAMGTPLLVVPGDGTPFGTVYGHPPTFTPGLPLMTPIGHMGFMPSHERIAPGGPGFSGIFHALPIGAPGGIAGSDVVPPLGATAIDFFLTAVPGSIHSFEITAIGSTSSLMIVVPLVAGAPPVYVGFGAFGETILDISIVKVPFPSTTLTTWNVEGIRVLPAPGTLMLALAAGALARRRR